MVDFNLINTLDIDEDRELASLFGDSSSEQIGTRCSDPKSRSTPQARS
jgi:hypothetical protein